MTAVNLIQLDEDIEAKTTEVSEKFEDWQFEVLLVTLGVETREQAINRIAVLTAVLEKGLLE